MSPNPHVFSMQKIANTCNGRGELGEKVKLEAGTLVTINYWSIWGQTCTIHGYDGTLVTVPKTAFDQATQDKMNREIHR